jgi:hypothetical protein
MFFKKGLKVHSVGTEEQIASVMDPNLGFMLQFANRGFYDKKIKNKILRF